MDNNFDKLFKTKVEQQNFDYNPKEWESFLKKQASNSSKISKGFSSQMFIASIIVGVAVISVIAYYFMANTENNSKNSTAQNIVTAQKDNSTITSNRSIVENKSSENKLLEPNTVEVKPEAKVNNSKPIQLLDNKSEMKPKNNSTPNTTTSTSIQTFETAETTKPNKTINSDIRQEQNKNNATNSAIADEPKVISESISNKSNVEINSTTKQIESTTPPVSLNKIEKEASNENLKTIQVENTELKVNNVSNKTENQAPVTPKKYAYEDYPVVGGEAKQKANFSFAQFKKTLENYLSISQIGLERSRDIATYINNHFIQDPSLSGFENRYTFSALSQVGAIVSSIENKKTPPYEYTLTNSFPIRSKNMGVGIAFKQVHGGSYNSIMLNLSMAFQAVINRNSSIYFGGGINAYSIDKTEAIMADFPWSTNTPRPIKPENQASSVNLGVRYLHKSIYAGISATNVYSFAFTGDYHKSLSPFTLQLSSGGKLRLNQTWSLNPSFNYQYTPYSTTAYFIPYVSLSKLNKLYFGIHSENFQSLGAHIGYRAANSVNIFLRSGASLNKSLRDAYGIIHYGEIGFRIELGNYQK